MYKLYHAWNTGPLEFINPDNKHDRNGYVCFACRHKVVGVYEKKINDQKIWICSSCKDLNDQALAALIAMVSPVEVYGSTDFIIQRRPIGRIPILDF